MKTKLLMIMMDLWARSSASQDGIVLVKTVRDICHKKDGGANSTTKMTAAQREELIGMAHVSIVDIEFEGIGFVQNESSNPLSLHHAKC